MNKHFTPLPEQIFFSRDRRLDPRIGDYLHNAEAPDAEIIMVGYPDDEGIKNNLGRAGASEAPNVVRHYLFKMTPPVSRPQSLCGYGDLGNLDIKSISSLTERHEIAKSTALKFLNDHKKWISIGGGHDYAYADGSAFCEWALQEKQRPLLLNFDAHLDVRPYSTTINSGTGFSRLLDKYESVDFYEIGIQAQCNSHAHLEYLQSKSGQVLFQDEILTSGKPEHIKILEFLEPILLKKRPVYISLDIDVFSSHHAPGCSQSWPLGLDPNELWKVFEVLKSRLDVRAFGIYEVSPPLDVQDQTAKLAAQFIYQQLTR